MAAGLEVRSAGSLRLGAGYSLRVWGLARGNQTRRRMRDGGPRTETFTFEALDPQS